MTLTWGKHTQFCVGSLSTSMPPQDECPTHNPSVIPRKGTRGNTVGARGIIKQCQEQKLSTRRTWSMKQTTWQLCMMIPDTRKLPPKDKEKSFWAKRLEVPCELENLDSQHLHNAIYPLVSEAQSYLCYNTCQTSKCSLKISPLFVN